MRMMVIIEQTKEDKDDSIKIIRRGYTPYGYLIEINNRVLEFATETEADEYIAEVLNGF